MKRILIFTAGYGEGHNAAARALAAGLNDLGADAEVRDLFLESYGHTQEISQRIYIECINRAAWMWLIAYRLMDWLPLMRFIIGPMLGKLQRRLATVLAEKQPHAVVSVYPAYGYLLDRLYPRGSAPFARHTLVTDSITINSVWHRCGSDTWLVPNEESAAIMRAARVPAEKIRVTGFPVPLNFADARPVRISPGADEPLRVLYMANQAKADAPAIIRQLLTIDAVKLTVTVGRDGALGRKIERIAREVGRSVEIHGWTKRMPELLMSSHVIIGKAGGAATQEALAARTPMLITKVVPGQEEGNAQLIVEGGCGAVCQTPNTIVAQIETLLADNCALWHRWHAAITKLSRPNAARDNARFILQ